MKKSIAILFITLLSFLANAAYCQIEKYDPNADAIADVKAAVQLAKKSNKHVFVKVGGNWCSWCKLYAEFTHNNEEISEIMDENYIKVLVNWSKENKNPAAMEYLHFPQRFGYPVFIIIDGNGKIIHTQNSAYLEKGSGYDKNKILQFLTGWTPKAIDPDTYKN
ncbi:DUF255 domain-containing protein [Flammeovirga sp. SJP92]|uniref:DUF255 domain-containing protein n=1 Tax=Flammeovirga sp. SJP92 TaxID=1775430 RepID=UPI0007869A07|nr:thioredoxin family protein [Flammeovirga sp. SJP92]KXX69894.1 hypothetical protein AVL50_13510 [Flammeovirga sp. SJP92]